MRSVSPDIHSLTFAAFVRAQLHLRRVPDLLTEDLSCVLLR
jgi:hypothetical protein